MSEFDYGLFAAICIFNIICYIRTNCITSVVILLFYFSSSLSTVV